MCYDSVHIISDTHALIRFLEDERTAIVPVAEIVKKDGQIEYNGSCRVKWSNMKMYHAFLLFSGAYALLVIFIKIISQLFMYMCTHATKHIHYDICMTLSL